MRSALVFKTAFFAVSALAGAASAQSAATNSAGLRYLSWPGKAMATAPAPAPASTRNEPALRPTQMAAVVDASAAVPLARIGAPGREAPRPGLTPATAFYNPTYGAAAAASNGAPQAYVTAPVRAAPPSVQQAAPQPALQPTPQAMAQPAPAASMAMNSPNAPQQVRQPAPSPQPQQPQPQPQQVYAPAPAANPAPAPENTAAIADPMAPRRDAAIFRLQQNSGNPAPAAPGASIDAAAVSTPQAAETQQIAQAAPYSQQARYYSVHRQAGRHPDAISAPQQSYLNALPVELTQVPASKDMAEPDAPPQLIRDGNGRIRAMPQSQSDETP